MKIEFSREAAETAEDQAEKNLLGPTADLDRRRMRILVACTVVPAKIELSVGPRRGAVHKVRFGDNATLDLTSPTLRPQRATP